MERPELTEDELIGELTSRGIIFEVIPPEIYPGMLYITPLSLTKANVTKYSPQHIVTLIRMGVVPAHRVGKQYLLAPEGVELLLQRERQSLNGELNSRGKKPGYNSKTD